MTGQWSSWKHNRLLQALMSQFQHTTVMAEGNKCGEKRKQGRGPRESKVKGLLLLKRVEWATFANQMRFEQGPEGRLEAAGHEGGGVVVKGWGRGGLL